MASLTAMMLTPSSTTRQPPPFSSSPSPKSHVPSLSITCKAKNSYKTTTPTSSSNDASPIEIAAIVGGLTSNPIIAFSLYTLKTTGCGLPPGPGGSIGAAEGVSYLVVAGIVAWSAYTKVKTGSGLPSGPYGLLGAVEGLSYLAVVAVAVVFGLQFVERGYIPGPLPAEQCFGLDN